MTPRPEPDRTADDSARDPIAVVTLGCPKNLVDSESMLGSLHRAGFSVGGRVEDAALVVVNTCAFLTASQEESVETILELARLKTDGRLRHLVVAGCLPQRHGGAVLEEIPEVDYLLGPGTFDQVAEVARGLLAGELARGSRLGGLDRGDFDWEPRVLSQHRHTAYLKISEGCNSTCSFCIIPTLRGKHRSRPLQSLEDEARRLVDSGVRELSLVAQDSTSYGLDLYGRFSLDRLLERLARIDGLRWIRVLYTYPRSWTDRLVEAFGRLDRVVPYVDIPIQHAADSILRRMRRGAGWSTTERWLKKIRAARPDMVLRTTVITGFPGESEADFEILLEKLREIEFDHLGAFAYSNEDGTPAAELPGQVPEEQREERRRRLLAQQRAISLRRNRARIGRRLEVLIDRIDPEHRIARGRWSGQALEIDGQVVVPVSDADRDRVSPGAFLPVRIQGAGPYDLVGAMERSEATDE